MGMMLKKTRGFGAFFAYLLAGGALLGAVGGCTTVYDGKYPYDSGWRIGEIEKIGAAADLQQPGARCHRRKSGGAPTDRFAYVQFVFGATAGKYMYHGPLQRHVIAQLPPNSNLGEGDQVYVNIEDCDQLAVLKDQSKP